MKYIYLIAVLILLLSATKRKHKQEYCSEKGIKIARTYVFSVTENGKSEKGAINGWRELLFDSLGNATKMSEIKGEDTVVFNYEYENGKLMRTLRSRNKKLWEVFDTSGTPLNDWIKSVDTTKIVQHSENGLPIELNSWDGSSSIWSYEGPDKEIHRHFDEYGILIQEQTINKERGLLVLTTTVVHTEPKWTSVIHYYDYKFNRHGHWIKRKYSRGSNNIVYERRELEYY